MSTAFCLALLVATSAPQPASEGSPPEEAPADEAPAADPSDDEDEPAAEAAPDDDADAPASPESASPDDGDSAGGDGTSPSTSDEGVEAPAASNDDPVADAEPPTDPAEPDDDPAPAEAAPTDEPAPPAPVAEPATEATPPADTVAPDDGLAPTPNAGDDDKRAATSRRPADDDDLLGDDRPVTSALAVTGQVATGVAGCCCGLSVAGLIGGPLNLIPGFGPFIGPCVMQTGFCGITAILGGGAEVFVGDALGPGHGALLPVIGAQALAHLAASLVGTVVGFAALGVAVGLALPNLPADPVQQGAYLINDPGVIVASFITSAVFIAAIAASLAVGPIAYALTAEPKKTEGFQMPRITNAEPPPPPARVAHVRY